MNSTLRILGATAALVIAPLAGISYAAAQNGADDPAGHVRHSGDDDPTSSPSTAPTREAGDDHGRRHGGHGADDPATHDAGDDHGRRHGGHGSDD